MEKTGVGFGEKLRGPELPERERLASLHEVLRLPEGGDGAAGILLDLRLDADTLAASLLHAVSRDREPPEAARALAGEPALVLLKGLAKIDSLKTAVKTSVEAENLRHMLFALTGDIRVIIIKLAEQLARLRAFDRAGGEERKLAARECLDIYAPVANQLGISWMKDEMEDLSLKFLNRETYQQIKDFVGRKKESRDAFLEAARRTITEAAERAGITIRVKGRAKHFYSVYMKMRKRGKGADEIRDLAGIRIICDGIENCYTLLGLVHSLWEPIDGFFKDYVARPKPNGYASLHTSVLIGEEGDDAEGQILEIQIRTGEMDRLAEYGVASHWLYKKGASRDAERGKQVGVVNKMKGWRGDSSDSWLADIKRDLFGKWIFVFTPQGKVIRLPAGATPLDFAFQVHTAVGERCIGAKAGGSIIPLSSPLENAQVVEILTSPQARPTLNWLEMAKSSKARSKIRAWLEKNDESLRPVPEKKKPAAESREQLPAKEEKPEEPFLQRVSRPLSEVMKVRIGDEKNLLIRFAGCCSPVTGDRIVGYVSRGRGIIIHRSNCPSLAANPEFPNRRIEADWENSGLAQVRRFGIRAKFSANLFSEIEGAIRKRQGHLLEGRLEESGENRLSGIFTMQLADADDLKPVMKGIRGIPGILGIYSLE